MTSMPGQQSESGTGRVETRTGSGNGRFAVADTQAVRVGPDPRVAVIAELNADGHADVVLKTPPRRGWLASIAKLGFNIKGVKVLVNSEPYPDHASGLTVLHEASGAQLWASDASAESLARAGLTECPSCGRLPTSTVGQGAGTARSFRLVFSYAEDVH